MKAEGVSMFPRHVAIIMDGNGRWAARRGLPRIRGHLAGAASIREIVRAAIAFRIRFLTLFAFSVDNWKRPPAEVEFLMGLLVRYLEQETPELVRRGIRLRAIGRLAKLPAAARRLLQRCLRATRGGRRLTLTLAINYGGQEEIVDAARRLAARCVAGKLRPAAITPARFAAALYTGRELPPPDLLIRTAGEQRLSNFMLWQISYAELWVARVCWPDFHRRHLAAALADYARRQRKFGGLSAAPPAARPAGPRPFR